MVLCLKRRRFFRFAFKPVFFLYLLCIAAAYLSFGCSGNQTYSLQTIRGQTMGTTFMVKVVKDTPALPYNTFESEINTLLVEVNRQMSTYIEDSEISQFNRYRGVDWFAVSPDFAMVLQQSLDIAEQSGGALDITIGPLIYLWGFGTRQQDNIIPPDSEIEQAQKRCGYQHLAVQHSPPSVKKEIPEMYCDLSAIAKGFGVDKIAEYLASQGAKNFMVEIGGEVRTLGKNASGQPWRIGIETPNSSGAIQNVIVLENIAVATSGDYRNYFEKDGVRYSHTIDPRTGKPITHTLASVTVFHESCSMADGLATAINVLGPDAGYELAIKYNLAVFMLVKTENGFRELRTSAAEKFFP